MSESSLGTYYERILRDGEKWRVKNLLGYLGETPRVKKVQRCRRPYRVISTSMFEAPRRCCSPQRKEHQK